MPVQTREPADDVLSVIRHHLEEAAVVDDARDHAAHVVGLVGVVRDDRLQLGIGALRVVEGGPVRRLLTIVGRQIGEQVADLREGGVLVVGDEVRNATALVVHVGSAQVLERHLLTGGHLDHVGSGDEHVPDVPNHEDEIGHGR
jgi:hypothetical protein